ncbi:MAG: ribose 5-phosphate isomerase B [Bacteroidota bacterium]
METIPIGCDHGGFEIKQYLVEKLKEAGYDVKDFGTFSSDSVDYPDYVHKVASAIENKTYSRGIILCGSGNGAQITANKYPHVRAALAWKNELAKLGRQHNDANILSLPGRFVGKEEAWEMTKVFLNTDFEGGRHARRVGKMIP